jgi:acyl-homoserine lactone acylase PvdQ
LILRGFRRFSTVALATGALLAFSAWTASAAPPTPGAYQQNDFGGFRNILPPAQGANANSNQIAAFEANGTYPPHTSDQQLSMYANLLYATPGLQASQIPNFYKDASFGVKAANVERTYSPRGDVTIQRDKFGVPHIYGATRKGTMFGAGYAAAEDRLFMIDVLRHAARAQLSSFAGGSNTAMDESIWADTPYNESELQDQYDRADELYGQQGIEIQTDVNNYVAGVNKFISEACANPVKLPGEYNLIDPSQSICLPGHDWKVTDVIAIASLVAGIFGKGGGGELGAAKSLVTAQQRFGAGTGRKVWADFQSFNDPEAPTTVHGKSFPYGQPPAQATGVALPDPGTVTTTNVVQSASGSAKAPASRTSPGKLPAGILQPFEQRHGASNALLVAARKSTSGHPVAVMGPQVAYFSPQILMEEDIHAPATNQGPPIDARGAAFPGTNLYVQVGRGRDYSWSATSAGQDIIDTYAVKLCDPNGGTPTIGSDHYLFKGQCLPFEVLTRTNAWVPTPADQTAAGSQTLTTLRTKLGIVIARVKIHGQPYAYTKLRDTYFHEVDPSALGFANFNNPNKMRTPQDFMRAANHISLTFNWFYADDKHIAYFNSGANPVRPSNVDPNLPTFGREPFLWQNYKPPPIATEDIQPLAAHPHVIDQTFLTSWNNRQAPDYNTGFSSLFRSQPLDARIRRDIAGSGKMTLQRLISDMEDAGTVDLRGDRVLPWILKVINTQPVTDPARKAAVQKLTAWGAAGAHRIDRNKDGTYEHTQAIRIIDAWWPRLVAAEFKPTLGQALFNQTPFGHDAPGRIGSAFDTSSYGYVQKDLRDLLGASVQGPYSRVYCGKGNLVACRNALLSSLSSALQNDSNAKLYGGQTQAAHDEIGFRAIGAITQPNIPWVNRPTFQQAVEIPGHR